MDFDSPFDGFGMDAGLFDLDVSAATDFDALMAWEWGPDPGPIAPRRRRDRDPWTDD